MRVDTTNTSRLILFVRTDCEFCAQVLGMIEDVSSNVEFSIYKVFPSRVAGKVEIKRSHGSNAGLPVLVDAPEIPGTPCLFDPIGDERIVGINEIERYFIECGLLPEDDEG